MATSKSKVTTNTISPIATLAALLDASATTLARLKQSLGLPVDLSGLETKDDATSKYNELAGKIGTNANKIDVLENNLGDLSDSVNENSRNIGTLQAQITTKAEKSDLDPLISKDEADKTFQTKSDATQDKQELEESITENAEAISELKTGKQDKLTAGKNITIGADNTISASGGGVIVRNWAE